MYEYIHVDLNSSIFRCVQVYGIHRCMKTCIYIHTYICIYINLYVYINGICMYMYTYTYM